MKGRRRAATAIAAVAASLLLLQSSWSPGSRAAAAVTPGVQPSVVAVLPFRVRDPAPGVVDLRDWLQDLLVARLTGEGSPRALTPAVVAGALRRVHASPGGEFPPEVSRKLKADLGAGLLLTGEVAGTPTRLELAATLAADGAPPVQAQVAGSADSLPYLADQLAVRLLAARAGGEEDRAALATTSLSALRAYLAGREAYRRGLMHEAEEYLDRALLLDSTFGPAALGVAILQSTFHNWAGGEQRWLADACWSRRHRMNAADRALLIALLGPHYPGPSTQPEMIAAAENATRIGPQQVEAWNILGKYRSWFGPTVGLSDWAARSIAAFGRAFALDSTNSQTLENLIMMAATAGDTAAVRRFLPIYVAYNTNIETQASVQWLAADALGDSAARRALRAQFASLGETNLFRINWWGQPRGGAALEDADLAIKALLAQHASRRVGTAGNRAAAWSRKVELLFNQGRPREASRVLDQLNVESFVWGIGWGPHELRLYAGLYWDGDRRDEVAVAGQLEAYANSAARGTADREGRQMALCTLAEWRAASGNWDGAQALLARMDPRAGHGDFFGVPGTKTCEAAVAAMVAAGRHEIAAGARLERLDSLLRAPWLGADVVRLILGNLIAARLHEARGDVRRALDALRRIDTGALFLSTKLREEGRLAAQVGDTAGAIRAYRHYLELRSAPEPEVLPEVERVRGALQRLEASEGRN
ncbi:MAG TPA: hypothetical protein VGQ06_00265 [Gemmatimonadales bacterium]|jgi:tetratricopeptide (TPR) repeat protein|nr:hypothetical protein [Gemmatimonadales bacterium]